MLHLADHEAKNMPLICKRKPLLFFVFMYIICCIRPSDAFVSYGFLLRTWSLFRNSFQNISSFLYFFCQLSSVYIWNTKVGFGWLKELLECDSWFPLTCLNFNYRRAGEMWAEHHKSPFTWTEVSDLCVCCPGSMAVLDADSVSFPGPHFYRHHVLKPKTLHKSYRKDCRSFFYIIILKIWSIALTRGAGNTYFITK